MTVLAIDEKRGFMRVLRCLLYLLILILSSVPVAAQSSLTAPQNVPLYAGPGTTYIRGGTLNIDQPYTVSARNRLGNWVRIQHAEDADFAGWAQTGQLAPGIEQITLSQITLTDQPAADIERADTTEAPAVLYQTPVLPAQIDRDRLRAIYQRGQERGNDPNAVVKIGDCNTASGLFLTPISTGAVELGAYDYLQDTVNAFGASFGRDSIASRDGFNVSSIFDPLWAVDESCNPNEPPLLCEYRNNPGSVAFIMFGQNDIFTLNRDQYEANLRDVIERSIDYGVIPVLSTFTNRPEFEDKWHQVLALNVITIELAQEYNIPLINFWLAARGPPRLRDWRRLRPPHRRRREHRL